MTANCKCNNCSAQLEFDAQSAGQTTTCPYCGMETMLYIPGAAPKERSQKPALPRVSPYAQTLTTIRSQSCYRTLRTAIGAIFLMAEIAAGAAAVLYALATYFVDHDSGNPGLKAVTILGSILGGIVTIGLLHAAHQASLLLVDIADCNLRLVTAERNRAVEGFAQLT